MKAFLEYNQQEFFLTDNELVVRQIEKKLFKMADLAIWVWVEKLLQAG